MNARRHLRPVVAAAAVLGLLVSMIGVAASAPRGRAVSRDAVVSSGSQAQTRTWTARTMRAARPMPLPTVRAGAEDGAVQPLAHGGWAYPTPFDRHPVFPNYQRRPYKTVGKLFFSQNGTGFVCSAAVVGDDAVWTAGHCVSDGSGTFSTNVVFAPARRNGSNPYGTFTCSTLWTTTDWHVNGDLTRDSGGAEGCSRPSDGKGPGEVVGKLGFAWNQATEAEHYNVLGYPAASPFDGERQIQCQSSFGHFDTAIPGVGPDPYAVGCDATGGVSGGAYIINFSPGTTSLLNGNASYRYVVPSQPLELFSPYFDDLSKTLFDCLTAEC